MNYPLLSEYIEAIKAAGDNFKELTNLRPVLNEDGEPMFSSGNFAVVFKMRNDQTGKLYAVKCFLKEQEGRSEAYRLIAEELEYVSSTFLTPIKYLDKELFVDTAQTTETEFPVLLMDWVEGQTLDKYIREHIDDQYELSLLAYQFSRLAMWLLPQPFAHGDLKPDNILVKKDGTLVLVDYDGMYVPAMKGQKARELGSPDFRHPSRTEDDFDEHIDDFSLVSILLSLKAIALQPELLGQYGASDRLLFSERDYRNLSESQVMDALKIMMQDQELASLYSLFILAISQNNLSLVSFRLFNLSRPDRTRFEEETFSTEVTEEDLANAWIDDYGVKYSADKKRLLLVPDNITEYKIRKGTRIVCDEAFGKPNLAGKRKHNINTLYIPDSVSIIGSESLYGCLHLCEIVVSKKNRIYDSRDNCNAIIRTENNELLFGCQATVIPNNVSTISINAFLSCSNLKSINIPNSVISIGEQAFMNCGQLKEIYIPASIKEIGDRAFNGCDIERVIVDKANSIYDSRDNGNAIILTNENRLIFGCKKTTIPKSVTDIGVNSFECCDLKTIEIPNNVKEICKGAFMACSDLQSVTFSSSLSSIDDYAFSCCANLTYITFSNSVKNIGFNAFWGCNKITKIYIPKETKEKFEQLLPEYKDKFVEQNSVFSPLGDKNLSIIERCQIINNNGKWIVKCTFVKGKILKFDLLYLLANEGITIVSQSIKMLQKYGIDQCDGFYINPKSIAYCKQNDYSYLAAIQFDQGDISIKGIIWGLHQNINEWKTKEVRSFSQEERDVVKRAEVVPSQYGLSVCFDLVLEGQTLKRYIPLSNQSDLKVDDVVDLSTAKLITLSRAGDDDIYRVLE